ncbi:MAG: TauD/TfdA dioxygenase family protein [Acetobacteraceae bacterium]
MSATLNAPMGHGIPLTGPRPGETRPLAEIGGIEITDIDLSRPLSDGSRDRLLATFRAHPVMVFRNQRLDREQQFDFTTHFGEVETKHVGRFVDSERYTAVHTVSNLDENGNPSDVLRERGNYYWHSDKSYHAVPSLMTMLHAVELPPKGGETQFANLAMAYAALPEAMKQRIAGLRAEHSWEASRRNSDSRPATEEQKRERPPVQHPLVRTHPDTGAKVLYLGNHASHIVGWPYKEGHALLAELLAHATQGRFVYTHAWRTGDLVMWDNRCLVHRALTHQDMGSHRRVLHRTVVTGTVPY